MRAVVQRVTGASVSVEGQVVAEIGTGLCVLLGISRDDTPSDASYIVKKILDARMFEDASGKRWNKSVKDLNHQILCVSQVTLYHKFKGNKLDFHTAMSPEPSKKMFEDIVEQMRQSYERERVKSGVFGAYCTVSLNNDGPVTLVIESPPSSQAPQSTT